MHGAAELTRQLVSIPSVNPMGKGLKGEMYSEARIAEFIAGYLQNLGVQAEIFGEDPDHPNLIARIDAGKQQTIMLEAHMDTVSEEKMTIDPFDPIVKDGKIYGRGSCDTKASLATYLHVIGEIIRNRKNLKSNIILACVKDEEYSFSGAKELVARGVNADSAIIGEPTELNIIYAHKGLTRFFIHTEGKSCHASMPWLGDNAIYKMGPFLEKIQAYAESLRQSAHPLLGSTTINVGRINGGQTVNTVPALCSIEIDHRLLPGMSYSTVKSSLQEWLGNDGYIIDAPYMEALGVQNDIDAFHCRALLEACNRNGVDAKMQTAHYATDAAIIHQSGIPCVVFGPGSISQAHTADEHIAISDIEKASDILMSLLTQ